jgi:hypothetical protein
MRDWTLNTWHDGVAITKYAVDAARNGYWVIPLHPGRKDPLCTLNSRELAKAGVHHPCGVSHATNDVKVVRRVFKRLEETHGRINLGVALHPSRLVTIDADNPDEVDGVRDWFRELGADEEVYGLQPTVATPGVMRDGEWLHKDGTHHYFNVPDGIELPLYPGEMKLPGGAVLRWGNSYNVAPPSIRPEGRYVTLTDTIPDLPLGALTLIRDRTTRRAEQARQLIGYANEPVVAWSVMTPWATLLEPQGWQFPGKLDRQCGCPVWRRPGEGQTSDRSAIAHENDCQVRENREGHGSLHVFSDNVPGPIGERVSEGIRDFTKLQFVALVDFDGDESEAQVALGLTPDYSMWTMDNDSTPHTHVPLSIVHNPPDLEVVEPVTRDDALTSDHAGLVKEVVAKTGLSIQDASKMVRSEVALRLVREGVTAIEGGGTGGASWLPYPPAVMVATARRDKTPSTQGALIRSDGKMAFTLGKLHQLFGQASSGKTFSMMQAMLEQVQLGYRTLYCDFEDTKETFVDRYMDELGVDVVPYMEAGLLCYSNPAEPPPKMDPLIEMGFRLVVVDSLSEVVSSINDGSMKDGVLLRRLLRRFRELAQGGAAVVLIAHGSEKVDVPGSSLGASEIRQALTGQDVLLHIDVSFDKKKAGRSLIYIAKDRGGDVAGDTDTDDRQPNKVQRRLWGAMVVSPTPIDDGARWVTSIEFEPAHHAEQEPGEKAIDWAERLIIAFLLDRADETATQMDMVDDLVDENKGLVDRTVRRAVRRLLNVGMAHVVGHEASDTGGRPSPIIKLGPKPEEVTE